MSYFRTNIEMIDGYVPGFQPADTDVVKLNTNENPYPPSPKVIKAIKGLDIEKIRRYPQPLGDDFRNAAAEILGVGPKNIMCSNGGDDLLNICVRAFCDNDRPLAYPVPTYSLYPVLAGIQGCSAIEIPFSDDFSLPDELYSTDAAMTIVCNPNAPTGTSIMPDQLKKLAQELTNRSVLLIDEAYVDFAESNCLKLINDCDNVIILRSMSKGYSLAGMRFGYAVADKGLIDGLMKVKDSYNVDAVAIAAAAAAIQDQKYFLQNVKKIKTERKRLTEQLNDMGFSVMDSSSNFILAKFVNGNAKEIYQALTEQNIYVRYFELEDLDDKLRISIGTKKQNDKLLAELKNILK